jgi:hypothetical protein
MLPSDQRGGEAKNNPQRVDETCKPRKITHLREDNSEIKLGLPGWGFSIGLVIQYCKKVTLRIFGRRETGHTFQRKFLHITQQEEGIQDIHS